MLGTDFFPLPITGGTAGTSSSPGGDGGAGFISKNYLMNFGGAGGGATQGGIDNGLAGAGGDGAPGCGGGAGAITTNNTAAVTSGNGGPGFVIIISW
jgi:hypothetical protein